jgi:hypothetical protein
MEDYCPTSTIALMNDTEPLFPYTPGCMCQNVNTAPELVMRNIYGDRWVPQACLLPVSSFDALVQRCAKQLQMHEVEEGEIIAPNKRQNR